MLQCYVIIFHIKCTFCTLYVSLYNTYPRSSTWSYQIWKSKLLWAAKSTSKTDRKKLKNSYSRAQESQYYSWSLLTIFHYSNDIPYEHLFPTLNASVSSSWLFIGMMSSSSSQYTTVILSESAYNFSYTNSQQTQSGIYYFSIYSVLFESARYIAKHSVLHSTFDCTW